MAESGAENPGLLSRFRSLFRRNETARQISPSSVAQSKDYSPTAVTTERIIAEVKKRLTPEAAADFDRLNQLALKIDSYHGRNFVERLSRTLLDDAWTAGQDYDGSNLTPDQLRAQLVRFSLGIWNSLDQLKERPEILPRVYLTRDSWGPNEKVSTRSDIRPFGMTLVEKSQRTTIAKQPLTDFFGGILAMKTASVVEKLIPHQPDKVNTRKRTREARYDIDTEGLELHPTDIRNLYFAEQKGVEGFIVAKPEDAVFGNVDIIRRAHHTSTHISSGTI